MLRGILMTLKYKRKVYINSAAVTASATAIIIFRKRFSRVTPYSPVIP